MPTRQGWGALGAGVGAILSGRVFGLLELFVVGTALVVAVAVAMVVVRRPLPKLQVQRVLRPALVAVGEPARVDLVVTNRAALPSPRLKLWEPVGDKGGAPMQLAPLASGHSCSAAYRVPTARRGALQTGPLRAERTDPLGLAGRGGWMAGADEVLVVPERIPLPFPQVDSPGRLGQYLRMKAFAQNSSEFHSHREYVPGDDLRRISWKASARVGDLIVRETTQEGLRHCTVVLDTLANSYADDSFERAVSAAASVVSAAAAEGVTTRLVAPGIDLRGPEVAPQSLRWLATVEVGGATVGHDAFAHGLEGLCLLVVVTGHPRTRVAAAAGHIAGPDDVLVTICTTTTTNPVTPDSDDIHRTHAFQLDGTSLTALEEGWNALVFGNRGGS
jgi:uncharacterized protein (DUF58 family)